MPIGLYLHRRSPLHRLPASIKLLSLLITGLGIFWIDRLSILVGLAIGIGGLWRLAQLPLDQLLGQLRQMAGLLLVIFLLQGWATGWEDGAVVVLRFVGLVLLAALVSLTTRTSDLLAAIEWGLAPLKHVGINGAQVSFMLSIAIRFIPILLEQWQAIQEAQRARGLDRYPIALLIPWFIKTLRMADELVDALDARGYGLEEEE